MSDPSGAVDVPAAENGTPSKELSGFSCPECGGRLWEVADGELLRYRCRVGHAYSSDSLVEEQSESLEASLYAALNALEESAALSRRLADSARGRQHELTARRLEDRAEETSHHAAMLRQVLLTSDVTRPIPLGLSENMEHEDALQPQPVR